VPKVRLLCLLPTFLLLLLLVLVVLLLLVLLPVLLLLVLVLLVLQSLVCCRAGAAPSMHHCLEQAGRDLPDLLVTKPYTGLSPPHLPSRVPTLIRTF
jgi:hypothetical protein